MLRILSWNILHGGGKRAEDIIVAIEAHQPDIVTLQEFRHSGNRQIILDGLVRMGLIHQFVPETLQARDNTLIIASRLPFDADVFPVDDEKPAHAVSARFTEPLDLSMIAVHLPHKKRQLPYFNELLDLPKQYLTGNSLLIGDFNCGIPFEDSETRSFYATHLFQQLLQNGWIDAWRSRHKNSREFTWISTKQQNGFRYDHVLVSPSLNAQIATVKYDHQVRINGSSDHSLLILDLSE
ncbi:MAG: endonuclease/exonuclease/phosphatase family protein [Gammaproteobacteria bacterium]